LVYIDGLFFIFIFLEPSAGPVNVGAIAVSSTAINVTWGDVPLYQRNGIILGYRVSTKRQYKLYSRTTGKVLNGSISYIVEPHGKF
jgi:hypothetical protein